MKFQKLKPDYGYCVSPTFPKIEKTLRKNLNEIQRNYVMTSMKRTLKKNLEIYGKVDFFKIQSRLFVPFLT